MGLKGVVMQLLRAGDSVALENLVAREPQTVRHLVGRLWDTDEQLRAVAAQGLGAVAAHHPEQAMTADHRHGSSTADVNKVNANVWAKVGN